MVVERPIERETTSRLFHALADATRRDIVRRALDGELSVSALARSYPISLPAVQKHVAVLVEAELVIKQRRGREQIVRADATALRRAHDALDRLELAWRERLERAEALLTEPDEEKTQGP